MTVVLQHQFYNLQVTEERFQVELTFDNIPEKLVIPFAAVKGFLDPAVQFGLQFEVVEVKEDAAAKTEPGAPADAADKNGEDTTEPATDEPPKVVSLDAFRKK
jgi:hypothetical protein